MEKSLNTSEELLNMVSTSHSPYNHTVQQGEQQPTYFTHDIGYHQKKITYGTCNHLFKQRQQNQSPVNHLLLHQERQPNGVIVSDDTTSADSTTSFSMKTSQEKERLFSHQTPSYHTILQHENTNNTRIQSDQDIDHEISVCCCLPNIFILCRLPNVISCSSNSWMDKTFERMKIWKKDELGSVEDISNRDDNLRTTSISRIKFGKGRKREAASKSDLVHPVRSDSE